MSDHTQRISALVSAMAYLAMALIAPAVDGMFDAQAIASFGAEASGGVVWPEGIVRAIRYRFVGLSVVAALDVVIALALVPLFRARSPRLALWMAAMRLVYAALFGLALLQLSDALALVRSGAAAVPVMDALSGFDSGWGIAFFAFGIHLMLLGWLMFPGGALRAALGVLLVIAGAGYFVDSALALVLPDITFRFRTYTFIGEVAFMIWLFARGIRGGTGNR